MTDFMVLVERAVRPITAGPVHKLRMREELLAHLTGVYEQELARLGDDAAARAEAARRFGDPSELTRDLEQALTVRDRAVARIDGWFGWRPGEAPWRWALRLAGLVALIVLPVIVCGSVAAEVRRPDDPSVPPAATLLRLWAAVLACSAAGVSLGALSAVKIRDALYGDAAARSPSRAAGYAALLALAAPTAAAAAALIGLAGQPGALAAAVPRDAGEWLINGLASLAFPLLAVQYARATAAVAARRTEWARLDIG